MTAQLIWMQLEIRLDGNDISRVPAERREMSLVFQKPLLFPFLTVAENVALPGNILNRKSIFSRMRLPNDSNFRPQSMPKAFGDDYDKRSQKVGTAYLSQTRTQYALLNQWMLGNFVSDWQGIPVKPTKEEITPEGLDRAALENSVGGAFYPGIEASWLIRKKEVFSEPFRIKHDAAVGPFKVRAGFFSQQMAVFRGKQISWTVPKNGLTLQHITPGGLHNAPMMFSSRLAEICWNGRAVCLNTKIWCAAGQLAVLSSKPTGYMLSRKDQTDNRFWLNKFLPELF